MDVFVKCLFKSNKEKLAGNKIFKVVIIFRYEGFFVLLWVYIFLVDLYYFFSTDSVSIHRLSILL